MYKFEPDPCTFSNADTCPDAAAFNQFGPNGLLNMTSVYEGVNLFLSKPHFLDGDQSLLDGVKGLNPDYDQHQTFYLIEPISGSAFENQVRIQSNFYVSPIVYKMSGNEQVLFKDLSPVYLPLMWSETSHKSSDETISSIANAISEMKSDIYKTRWIFDVTGGVLIVIGVFLFVRGVQKFGEEYESQRKDLYYRVRNDESVSESERNSRIFGFLARDLSGYSKSRGSVVHSRNSSSRYGTFFKV